MRQRQKQHGGPTETDGATHRHNKQKETPTKQTTHERALHTRNEGPGSDTTKNYQPEAGTWSPTKPDDPLTDLGVRLKIARAFSRVKGAADALCNPKAGVPGANQWTGRGRCATPHPASLQDERAEGGATLGKQGSSILKGAFTCLHLMENVSQRGR